MLVKAGMKIVGDTGSDLYMATKTTLKVVGGPRVVMGERGEKPTVSCKWYKTTADNPSDADWTVIEGATEDTYLIPAADVGVKAYKVDVAGTGDYYGSFTDDLTAGTGVVENSSETPIPVKADIRNANNRPVHSAVAGNVLTGTVSVAAAEPYITYTWTLKPADGSDEVAVTGKTYTVPATAKPGDIIVLSLTSSVKDFSTASTDSAEVKTELTSVKLTSSASWDKSTTEEGHDGVANPNVGEVLYAEAYAGKTAVDAADVVYEWYADDELIEEPTTVGSDGLMLDRNLFGKAISAKAIGKRGGTYAGASAVSEASGVVSAMAALEVVNEEFQTLDEKTPVKVGEKVMALVEAYCYDGSQASDKRVVPADIILNKQAAISWSVGGVGVAIGNDYTFVADDEGSAWACDVTGIEPAFEGALSFCNNLEVYPADEESVLTYVAYEEDEPLTLTSRQGFGGGWWLPNKLANQGAPNVYPGLVAYDQFGLEMTGVAFSVGEPTCAKNPDLIQRDGQYRYIGAEDKGIWTLTYPISVGNEALNTVDVLVNAGM
jgi:uncharacterized protein YodC (DUF2158 family)